MKRRMIRLPLCYPPSLMCSLKCCLVASTRHAHILQCLSVVTMICTGSGLAHEARDTHYHKSFPFFLLLA